MVLDLKATFEIDKECKHSRRYACKLEGFPIKSIYVDKTYAEGNDSVIVALGLPEDEQEDT